MFFGDEQLCMMVVDEVKKFGKPVSMNSKYCEMHLASHENCVGCESEAGCKMVFKLTMIAEMSFLKFMLTKDNEDAVKHLKDTRELIQKILTKKKIREEENHGKL